VGTLRLCALTPPWHGCATFHIALPRTAARRGATHRHAARRYPRGANIDTTTASGRLVFGIFAALTEFERELIRERTIAGLSSARARGRNGGRPYTMTTAKLRLAQAGMAKRDTKVGDLCKELGVTRQTLYRFVGPKGELRADGTKLLKRKAQNVSS
jgi:DNA invertase Pin-like site-specific DNA recombinase